MQFVVKINKLSKNFAVNISCAEMQVALARDQRSFCCATQGICSLMPPPTLYPVILVLLRNAAGGPSRLRCAATPTPYITCRGIIGYDDYTTIVFVYNTITMIGSYSINCIIMIYIECNMYV